MIELANDPEQLDTYAALRVELMHKWYLTLVKAINKSERFVDSGGNDADVISAGDV